MNPRLEPGAPVERQEGGQRTRGATKGSLPNKPLVSVVTVVKNGAAHLERAIESVLGQSWTNLEYLIVDGGSTDGTLNIVRRYDEQVDYWISEPDQGIYDAMNKGISLAKGDLIGLLNADDWYEPSAVASAAEFFAERGAEAVYYGDRYMARDDVNQEFEEKASFRLWLGMTVGHQAMFVHRSIYSRLGTYALKYRWASDFEFLVRAVHANVPFIPLGRFVVHFLDGGASTQYVRDSLREVRAILKAAYGAGSPVCVLNWIVTVFRRCVLWSKEVLRRTLGESMLLRLRTGYGRQVIARGKNVRQIGPRDP